MQSSSTALLTGTPAGRTIGPNRYPPQPDSPRDEQHFAAQLQLHRDAPPPAPQREAPQANPQPAPKPNPAGTPEAAASAGSQPRASHDAKASAGRKAGAPTDPDSRPASEPGRLAGTPPGESEADASIRSQAPANDAAAQAPLGSEPPDPELETQGRAAKHRRERPEVEVPTLPPALAIDHPVPNASISAGDAVDASGIVAASAALVGNPPSLPGGPQSEVDPRARVATTPTPSTIGHPANIATLPPAIAIDPPAPDPTGASGSGGIAVDAAASNAARAVRIANPPSWPGAPQPAIGGAATPADGASTAGGSPPNHPHRDAGARDDGGDAGIGVSAEPRHAGSRDAAAVATTTEPKHAFVAAAGVGADRFSAAPLPPAPVPDSSLSGFPGLTGAAAPHHAGTAAVPSAALPTPLAAPDFAKALGAQVSVFARDGLHQAELQLTPAEMGPIRVHIAIDGAHARVDFAADSATTRQVIERGLPELASALREQGLTLAGGGVFQRAPDERGEGGAPDSRASRTRGRRPAAEAVAPATSPAARARAFAAQRGGVDLYA